MDSGWISHGLAILAPAPAQAGHEVDLIDLRALKGWEHFRAVLMERQPDVLGVTMMSVDYNPAMRCLRDRARGQTRASSPWWAGPTPPSCPRKCWITPTSTTSSWARAKRPSHRRWIAWPAARRWQRVIPGTHPDLDRMPYADHDLFLDEWRGQGYAVDSPEAPFVEELPPPFVTVIAGRGCIYNCSYCQPAERSIFGRKVRRRSVENVIGELRELRDRYQLSPALCSTTTA